MRRISVVRVNNHGWVRWRVLIPPDLAGGKRKAKFCDTKTGAEEFAQGLMAQRHGPTKAIKSLTGPEEMRLALLWDRCGGLEAVEAWAAGHSAKESLCVRWCLPRVVDAEASASVSKNPQAPRSMRRARTR